MSEMLEIAEMMSYAMRKWLILPGPPVNDRAISKPGIRYGHQLLFFELKCRLTRVKRLTHFNFLKRNSARLGDTFMEELLTEDPLTSVKETAMRKIMNKSAPLMVRTNGDGAVARGNQDFGKGPASAIEQYLDENVPADDPNSLAPPRHNDNDYVDDDHGDDDDDEVPNVTLAEDEQESLLRSLFDSAANYLAISTENPRLPEGHQLPLNRQIAMLRALRGWTQLQLARHANVSQTDVSRAECDNPTAKRAAVEKICQVLKIPL